VCFDTLLCYAEDHEASLAKAHEVFMEQATMDKKIAALTKDQREVSEKLVATQSAVSTWERKALVVEAQVKKDHKASDGVIKHQEPSTRTFKASSSRTVAASLVSASPCVWFILLESPYFCGSSPRASRVLDWLFLTRRRCARSRG
jgi:recombinational DNA repair ATPase RecF